MGEVERPVRTTTLAKRLQVSREHLSRQFGAGGAPNLKRVIDLTRVACAAQLLANPGYSIPTVVRVLHFASSSHLSSTSRRIADVSTRGLGALGPRGVLQAFVRGNTRSRPRYLSSTRPPHRQRLTPRPRLARAPRRPPGLREGRSTDLNVEPGPRGTGAGNCLVPALECSPRTNYPAAGHPA